MSLDELFGRTLDKISRRELITPLFEKALVDANLPPEYAIKIYNDERIWDGYFHPSSDLDYEPLQLFYKFNSKYQFVEEKINPQLLLTFQIGSAYHALVQSLFLHLGFTKEEDIEYNFLDSEHWVSGHVDVRWFYLPDGRKVPVEIKSCAYLPDKKPFAGHNEQLQMYMDLACDHAELGVVFYIEKNTPHRTKEFIVERDEEFLEKMYSKFKKVKEAVAFDDPTNLRDCCVKNSKMHNQCPARFVCRIGAPDKI